MSKPKNRPEEITVHVMHAFALNEEGGNPAGVCVVSHDLPDNLMLKIAFEMGFSETVFIRRTAENRYITRFFTPRREVDLCGHAVIAAFGFLHQKGCLESTSIVQITRAGTLPLEIGDDGTVMMSQPLRSVRPVNDPNGAYRCLGLDPRKAAGGLDPLLISTGLPDIMLPVTSRTLLASITPDETAMSRYLETEDAASIHAFTLDTPAGIAAYCRNFAPLLGIPEESATGTASGALSVYLHRQTAVSGRSSSHFVFEQGHEMGAPSRIVAEIESNKDVIVDIRVGGKAIYRADATRRFTV